MNTDDLDRLATARALARSGRALTLRESAGLSRAEVAGACGVSRVTVHRWENGDNLPRAEAGIRYGELLERLARREALA